MKRCPKCGCKRFLVTQHVTQTVMVDDDGEFITEVTSCDEVLHAANNEDVWTCEQCGYADAGSAFSITNADRIRNMDDEELLDFLCSIRTYGDEDPATTIQGGPALCSVNDVEEWLKNLFSNV